jgi:hypothetical protein
MKNYRTWLWAVVVLQILNAVLHGIGVISGLQPTNDAERHLIDLLNSTKLDVDGIFTPSFSNLFTALSSCFSLLYFFAGFLNAYLLRTNVFTDVLGGILLIQLIVLGSAFGIMLYFTFLLPIVMTGLVFLTLAIAWVLLRTRGSITK